MPLHLLGKKSWNVYNTSNIETVRRDEARAAALEEAEDARLDDLDAQRRMQILRGETPTPLAIEETPPSPSSKSHKRLQPGEGYNQNGTGRERKRRKKAGENDTDFEMRVAREQENEKAEMGQQLVLRKETGEAPLTDHRGHIDLFPQPEALPSHKVEKNAEAEKELARKKKEYEDQYTMRFDNAAGFKVGLEGPWYSKGGETVGAEGVSKDVWGNDDGGRRREREGKRLVESDPLAMMKAGARQVREVKKEREKWRSEKERELKELDDAERRRRKRRREQEEEDSLDGFRLDRKEEKEPSSSKRREEERRERKHRHRHKDSRRSDYREEGRHRHRHRERHQD